MHVRRGAPDVQDPKLNSHSKLNCITACIQATKAGADEALMLDPHGFVATCNSTHFFIVRRGEVWTSSGKYCLAGITRANVLRVCRENGIPAYEKDFSLTEVYGARGGLRHRHLCRRRAGHEVDGRAHQRRAAARWWSGCSACTCSSSSATSPGSRSRDAVASGDVVGTTQHLDGDDARLGEPRRLTRHR